MKKILILCLLAAAASLFIPGTATAEDDITVKVDNIKVPFDVPPVLENGRVLVPFRLLAQRLQVDVNWNEQNRTVEARGPDSKIMIPAGKTTATVNGQQVELDVPAVIRNGRTLVPLRFFAENMESRVQWDGDKKLVSVRSPVREMNISAFYALGSSRASSWTELFGVPYPETAEGKTDMINNVLLGWYSLDKDGSLLTDSGTGWQKPAGWERILEETKARSLQADMVVHATDKDGRITGLIEDRNAVRRFARAVASEASLYDGVNLNLEGLGLTQEGEELTAVQENFTYLVRAVREELSENKTLTLTVHAPNTSYRGYSYDDLANYADTIIIMAHDYGPRPEPDRLVVEAVEMALESVPREKLVLAVSAPSETAASIHTRIGIAKAYRLSGISLWRLGIIGEEKWEQIEKTVQPI